ncbi:MAG: DUF484 family protein [Pseudomonadales bacterium]|nr:DUF484 family protein [Pseudomonadales bacterium]
MTEVTKSKPTKVDPTIQITADQVSDYLLQHPDFFEENIPVLMNLSVPHTETGESISLIERQVISLRAENKRLTQQLSELINHARTNDHLFEKAKLLILELISTNQLDEVRELAEQSMQRDFGSMCCHFWLVSEHPTDLDKRLICAADASSHLQRLVKENKPYCGLLKAEESALLFGHKSLQVGSAAILPLYAGHSLIAILAIANEDKNY